MAGHRKMDDPGNQKYSHDTIPDPNDIPNFRETVIDAASLYMDRHSISTILQVSEKELDKMCIKEFGKGIDDMIRWCQSVSDAQNRKCLRMLAQAGNPTAMNIYNSYVSKLQNDAQVKSSGIKVVGSLDINIESTDSENDGGVHLLPNEEK